MNITRLDNEKEKAHYNNAILQCICLNIFVNELKSYYFSTDKLLLRVRVDTRVGTGQVEILVLLGYGYR